MKGEVPLKGGDEYDMLTKARKYHSHRPGKAKRIKRKYMKRVRKFIKNLLRRDV